MKKPSKAVEVTDIKTETVLCSTMLFLFFLLSGRNAVTDRPLWSLRFLFLDSLYCRPEAGAAGLRRTQASNT